MSQAIETADVIKAIAADFVEFSKTEPENSTPLLSHKKSFHYVVDGNRYIEIELDRFLKKVVDGLLCTDSFKDIDVSHPYNQGKIDYECQYFIREAAVRTGANALSVKLFNNDKPYLIMAWPQKIGSMRITDTNDVQIDALEIFDEHPIWTTSDYDVFNIETEMPYQDSKFHSVINPILDELDDFKARILNS